MKKLFFLFLILFLVAFVNENFACKKKNKSIYSSVTLSRTPCYGRCPAYNLEVKNDGTLIYEGKNFTEKTGFWYAKVSQEKVAPIFEKMKELKIDTFPPNYKVQVFDLAGLNFKIVDTKNKEKTIQNAEFGPQSLKSFSLMIDELLNSDWTQKK